MNPAVEPAIRTRGGQPTLDPRPRRRSEPASAEVAAEARAEVTIAIGHIEVRSAPEPQRPQAAAPFRPRVSLDEFLKADRR